MFINNLKVLKFPNFFNLFSQIHNITKYFKFSILFQIKLRINIHGKVIMSEEVIISEIDNNKEEYIEFLRELIRAESYNPPGNEKNVALVIEKYLNNAGIKSEIFPFGDNRANLIAYLNDNFDGKNLLYNGHMDVVPPGNEEEWKYHPLSAIIKGSKKKQKIFGRGTVDMKAGLAAMIISLKILNKLEINFSGNLLLNAVADEETGGKLGTGWCLEKILTPRSINCDFVIIGEATRLSPLPKSIMIGEKGRLEVRIVANGISCHSWGPFMGKNAIYMMSHLIQNLDKLEESIPTIKPPMGEEKLKDLMTLAFPSKEIFQKIYNEQPLLQNLIFSLTQFTKSLNIIRGGIKDNVVPDFCEAIIDFRLLQGQTAEIILKGLTEVINKLGYQVKEQPTGEVEEVFFYIEVITESDPSIWENWENSIALKDFYNICEKIYKKKPYYFLFPATTDSNFYRNNGYCPETILFGPGGGSLAHTTDEYIEIEDYLNAIKVYTLFAYYFLK